MTVTHSPKDTFYHSADDKIVEMVERYVNREEKNIVVVTDDVGLKKRIEEISARYSVVAKMERATFWAKKEELGQEKINKINQELLKRWSKK